MLCLGGTRNIRYIHRRRLVFDKRRIKVKNMKSIGKIIIHLIALIALILFRLWVRYTLNILQLAPVGEQYTAG
jgi:hypothetical protein